MAHSQATKDKIRETLHRSLEEKGAGTKQEKACPHCGVGFFGRKKKKFCSKSCSMKYQWVSQTYRDKISDSMKQAPHKGWKSRSIKSYPERFWEDILTKNGFSFVREKHVTKRSLGVDSDGGYFLDFFFPDLDLDLEIDGKQHLKRGDMDTLRDSLLGSRGIKVVRLPWRGLKQNQSETWEQVKLVLGILNQ